MKTLECASIFQTHLWSIKIKILVKVEPKLQFTFVCAVEGGEGDNKEGCRVLPSINQMRKSPFGVPVTSQTLGKSKPRWETLDDSTDAVGVGVTHALF